MILIIIYIKSHCSSKREREREKERKDYVLYKILYSSKQCCVTL